MAKIISIFNQKGGVGKTTTTVNLSALVAEKGYKVLSIDSDPQGNATSGFGFNKNSLKNTLYHVLINQCEIEDAIIKTKYDRLSILPANIDLSGAEIELINKQSVLKEKLNKIRDMFDYIFIDCPPSIGILSINALVASDSVIVPIQCEYYSLEGVGQLIDTMKLVKKTLNSKLEIEGIILNMYDGRTNLSQQVAQDVKNYFKGKVYKTAIKRNVTLAEAPSYGKPISDYGKGSIGYDKYNDLANEFVKRSQ